MYKNIKKLLALCILLLTTVPFLTVYAQPPVPTTPAPKDYVVLSPLPNTSTCAPNPTTGKVECVTTLDKYLPAAFNLTVGIAVGLAFVVITFGGVMYATSDALGNKARGKEYIEDALIGLLLVIGAYTLLYTINPQILDFTLNIDKIAQTSQPIVATGTCTNCVTITGITTRHGNQISPLMLPKLNQLNSLLKANGIPWTITEAYPPTVTHSCTCHQKGTCVDAYPINKTPGYLNTFATYAKQAGMDPQYEVKTDAEKQRLLAGDPKNGIPPYTGGIIKVVPTINGAHFSVYNTTCHQ